MTAKAPQEVLAENRHLASPAALAAHLGEGQYQRAKHIDILSEHLVNVAMGDITRLMVLMPPRHSKSETCSHWFPTWLMGLLPDWEIILASYGHEFAREWGLKVRNSVKRHWPELNVTLADDSKAAHRWKTDRGGGMQTVGVGGEVTGKGGQILILDDPVKNAEEAQSPAIQQRNWDWWKSTFRTRLTPKADYPGAIVVIGTRWDEEDLIGKLLQAHRKGPGTEGYEPWTVLKLPAVATEVDVMDRRPGDPLWPEKFDAAALAALEVSVGPHWWAAQFQQNPQTLGGNLLRESWWRYWVPRFSIGEWAPVVVGGVSCPIVEVPEDLVEFQSWDMNFQDEVRAVQKGRKPDPVAGHVWGCNEADMFLLDRRHGPMDLEETIEAVRQMSTDHPAAKAKLVEYTANGPAVVRTLTREIGGFVPITPIGSKTQRVLGQMTSGATEAARGGRAMGAQAYLKGGNMYLPHPDHLPWSLEVRRLFGLFPKDGRDDTDAMTQAWAHAQGRMWRDSDQAQATAVAEGPPPRTTLDIHRNRMRAAIASSQIKKKLSSPGAAYRRMRH